MKKGLLVSILALFLITACSALDSDSTPYEGFSPDVTPPIMGHGRFEGNYVGEMKLVTNECSFLAEELNAATELKLNVLQSSDMVSVAFEDASEVSGSLDENDSTIIVKRDISESRIYYLTFSDEGITGECEYIEGAPVDGQLGEPCATYTVELAKE